MTSALVVRFTSPWVPASKNKDIDKQRRSFKRKPASYSSNILPPSTLGKLGVEPASHLLLGFDKKKSRNTAGRTITAPDPNGMSGGPLWRFEIYKDQKLTSRLVGILIEWRTEVKGMLAIRMPILLAGIAYNYPHLIHVIPKTRTVGVMVTPEESV